MCAHTHTRAHAHTLFLVNITNSVCNQLLMRELMFCVLSLKAKQQYFKCSRATYAIAETPDGQRGSGASLLGIIYKS